jgi:hypothetical protein
MGVGCFYAWTSIILYEDLRYCQIEKNTVLPVVDSGDKYMKTAFAVILTVLLLSGCTYKFGTFSVISTKPVDLSKKHEKGTEKTLGEDTLSIYVIIPTKIYPDVSIALAKALEKDCADYLTDATIIYKWWDIPFIYGRHWVEVEGYPWFSDGEAREQCLREKKGE